MNPSDDGPDVSPISLERVLQGFLRVLEHRSRQMYTTDQERRGMKDIMDHVRAEISVIQINRGMDV